MNKKQLKFFHNYQLKDFRKTPLLGDIVKVIEEFYDWFNENVNSLSREELFSIAKDMQIVVRELEEMNLRYQRRAEKLLKEMNNKGGKNECRGDHNLY